eukprot:TRINITY_DN2200_c0_g1_i1.p1 TRINITY_DN2200_c0_g1~~TRINITY_DN2200_c0_g1_i1.p1  ORF type:complete len:165 (+),score=42.19 TRINITY_DN2200_c0_g1_i1:270-764(+)
MSDQIRTNLTSKFFAFEHKLQGIDFIATINAALFSIEASDLMGQKDLVLSALDDIWNGIELNESYEMNVVDYSYVDQALEDVFQRVANARVEGGDDVEGDLKGQLIGIVKEYLSTEDEQVDLSNPSQIQIHEITPAVFIHSIFCHTLIFSTSTTAFTLHIGADE